MGAGNRCHGNLWPLVSYNRVMKSYSFASLATLSVLFGVIQPVSAQWQTQSILIKPGWTAVYLHVDPSYTSLASLIGGDPANPISEVWLWESTASSIQYVTSPQAPVNGSSQWATWARNASGASTLSTLVPNAAYLIHSQASTNYTWMIKGRPIAPNYLWTSSGINLIDFPTVPVSPPALDNFLALVPNFQTLADIYQYTGGELGPSNPFQVFSPHSVPVVRGQAFWIRSGNYFNNYFGPFQVAIDGGADFGDSSSLASFHLRNTTPSTVTVQLQLIPSEASPAGQPAIVSVPPLVVRGSLNASNLTYTASSLDVNSSLSWTLPPKGQAGSDIVVILGVNRVAFGNSTPGLYAGILKFTDSYHFTEVDVPVSAQPASYSGLWVGAAQVSQVANYLKTYQRDVNNAPVLGSNGAYVVTGLNTGLGATASAFPLRLILHNDGTNVVLMQRVFFGLDASANAILATSETKLDPNRLTTARRISAVLFPWTKNNDTWSFSGQLLPGSTLTAHVPLAYDDQASNPFLHTHHPDHNNLDTSYNPPQQQDRGLESYDLNRNITLSMNTVGTDFDSLTRYGQSFQGSYSEAVNMVGIGGAIRTFNVTGSFVINRISPIAVLTRP